MRILIQKSAADAGMVTARILADQLRMKPESVLGLATGGTMEAVYASLISIIRADGIDVGRMSSFNLDEYIGLPPEHPQSYRSFMQDRLFGPLTIARAQTHLPHGDTRDPDAEAARYDAAIAAAGGIDLQLLGIGGNGHIGFNEPTSSMSSRTRVKTLTRQTRADNERFFGPGEAVPKYAITMGLGTIMEARHILLLATGPAKAQAVAAMVEGPVSARCPASILQFHSQTTIICDESAASALQLREYYETVHPGGRMTDLR